MPEIYALTDPRDGATRYIGKANSAAARFKGHMRDARRRDTPVYRWIRELGSIGMVPGLVVLETVNDWQSAERRLIAEHRARGVVLLNLAPGGNEPFCPTAVRAASGRLNAAGRDKRMWKMMLILGRGLQLGNVGQETIAKMRIRPDVFGSLFQYMPAN